MIETERLILRPPEPCDRAMLHAMWADPAVMIDLGPVMDEARADATLARHESFRGEGIGFHVVERRSDGALIGFCGLKRGNPGSPIAGQLEVGWMFATPYWGQGFAREAASASIDWGWANLSDDRIVAVTAARNLKSQRLMERLGMQRLIDGDFDHPAFEPGDPLRPTVTYVVSRP